VVWKAIAPVLVPGFAGEGRASGVTGPQQRCQILNSNRNQLASTISLVLIRVSAAVALLSAIWTGLKLTKQKLSKVVK
jgi:hypothetical protein